MEEYYLLNERDHPQPPEVKLCDYEDLNSFQDDMLSTNPVSSTNINQYNGLINLAKNGNREFGIELNSTVEKSLEEAKTFLQGEKENLNFILFPSKTSEKAYIPFKTRKTLENAGTVLEAGFLDTPEGIQYAVKLGKKSMWASNNEYSMEAQNAFYNIAEYLNQKTEATLSQIQTKKTKPTTNNLL
jgi:hypothetical protein